MPGICNYVVLPGQLQETSANPDTLRSTILSLLGGDPG